MPYSDIDRSSIGIKTEFFIGASTAHGYTSCCDDIFSKARKIYIIKGAPGTGKSHLMKKIADKASEKGYLTELFYCSSDADSLDAVYIPEKGICITDGTSPHIRDTEIPGSRDEIVDLGEFWDASILEKDSDKIINLMSEKKKLYLLVFNELDLCEKLTHQINSTLTSVTNITKLDSAALRLVKSFGEQENDPNIIYRQLDSIGMTGKRTLDTFRSLSTKHYYISGKYNCSSLFFDALVRAANVTGLSAWISRDPISGMSINALYFPNANVSFTNTALDNTGNDKDNFKIINMERFVSAKALHGSKNRLKLLSNFKKDIVSEIEKAFQKIKNLHFELEDIYGNSMDFEKVDKYSEKFIQSIFQ